MKNKKIRKTIAIAILFAFSIALTGCGKKEDPFEKIKDIPFTVIAEENLPEELMATIEEKKEEGFKVTFEDAGFVYICRGYGKQETGGYSISVNALYETTNAIYFDTTLKGPEPGENEGKKQSPSYPYVVIKTEQLQKPIVFD